MLCEASTITAAYCTDTLNDKLNLMGYLAIYATAALQSKRRVGGDCNMGAIQCVLQLCFSITR